MTTLDEALHLEDQMSQGNVLLFVWRHGVLDVDRYDSVEQAVRVGVGISDAGHGAPHGVQDGDHWITPDDDEWTRLRREEWAKQDAAYDRPPPATHVVEVPTPDGEWAQYQGYPNLDDAKIAAQEFRRARVRNVGPLYQRRTVFEVSE